MFKNVQGLDNKYSKTFFVDHKNYNSHYSLHAFDSSFNRRFKDKVSFSQKVNDNNKNKKRFKKKKLDHSYTNSDVQTPKKRPRSKGSPNPVKKRGSSKKSKLLKKNARLGLNVLKYTIYIFMAIIGSVVICFLKCLLIVICSSLRQTPQRVPKPRSYVA